MKSPINIVYFMRVRMNMTQKQVSQATGLTINDIARMEKGNFRARIEKFKVLADFFNISLESLLHNDIKLVLHIDRPKSSNHKLLSQIKSMRDRLDDIGIKGEEWVYQLELEKLKGTAYENAVNPNFTDDQDSHFDILSFSENGEHIMIETKTTSGDAGKPFYFSSDELKRARECLFKKERYEIHRVYYIDNPKKRGRYIIPVEMLFSEYEFEPICYKVVRKGNRYERS